MTQQCKFIFSCLATLVAALVLAAPGAFAQTAQGRISGQVTDSTGAAVPNATINIENLATHVSRTLQTNSTYTFQNASQPGTSEVFSTSNVTLGGAAILAGAGSMAYRRRVIRNR